MRRLVMVMDTTLNGKVDDVLDWLDRPSDDLYAGIDRGLDDFDTVLIGRATYEGMLAYWPDAETEEAGSPINRSHVVREWRRPAMLRPNGADR